MLERWLWLYRGVLETAECETSEPPPLREFVHFLTALKRAVEIGRLSESQKEREQHDRQNGLDPESLRRLFLGEDGED